MVSLNTTPVASVPLFGMVTVYSMISPGSALLSPSSPMMAAVMVAMMVGAARTIVYVPSAATMAMRNNTRERKARDWMRVIAPLSARKMRFGEIMDTPL